MIAGSREFENTSSFDSSLQALLNRNPCGVLALILKSPQLVAKGCRFVAIFRSLKMVFIGAGAPYGCEQLADSIVFALVHMFELAGDVPLIHGIGLSLLSVVQTFSRCCPSGQVMAGPNSIERKRDW
jgi:hypothetical protein